MKLTKPIKKMKWYICGPYRGINAIDEEDEARQREMNYLKVNEAYIQLVRVGYENLFSPISHSHPIDVMMRELYRMDMDDSFWLKQDLRLLAGCDGLILTGNYERSTGVRLERDLAEKIGLPEMTYKEALEL